MGSCACRTRQAVVDFLTRAWHRDQGRAALFSLIVVVKWINLYRRGGAACAARLSLTMPTGWTGFQASGLFGGCTRVSSFA